MARELPEEVRERVARRVRSREHEIANLDPNLKVRQCAALVGGLVDDLGEEIGAFGIAAIPGHIVCKGVVAALMVFRVSLDGGKEEGDELCSLARVP